MNQKQYTQALNESKDRNDKLKVALEHLVKENDSLKEQVMDLETEIAEVHC